MYQRIVCIFILINLCFSACNEKIKEYRESKVEIKYRAADSALVIGYFKDSDKFPDSLKNMVFTALQIHCPDLKDLNLILDHIKPDKLDYLRINSFKEDSVFDYDLNKFRQLKDLEIIGYEIQKINLQGNIDAKLKRLMITGKTGFPDFDSSFLPLENFSFNGVDSIIPKWIENLDQLKSFGFESKKLTQINCNICNMKSIKYFNISGSDLYQSEMYKFESTGKFNVLKKFKKCKPELESKNILPPK